MRELATIIFLASTVLACQASPRLDKYGELRVHLDKIAAFNEGCGLMPSKSFEKDPTTYDCSRYWKQHFERSRNSDPLNLEASQLDYPSYVTVQISTMHKVITCGGTLIDKKLVLTAASCIHHTGSTFILVKVRSGPREVDYYPAAAACTKNKIGNKVAVLVLSKPVPFNNYNRPACLGRSAEFRMMSRDAPCLLVGMAPSNKNTTNGELEVVFSASALTRVNFDGNGEWPNLSNKCWYSQEFGNGKYACPGDAGSQIICLLSCSEAPRQFAVGISYISPTLADCRQGNEHCIYARTDNETTTDLLADCIRENHELVPHLVTQKTEY